MELLVVLLFGLVIVAGTATVRAMLKDGHGHTPVVRSTRVLERRQPAQRTLLVVPGLVPAGVAGPVGADFDDRRGFCGAAGRRPAAP